MNFIFYFILKYYKFLVIIITSICVRNACACAHMICVHCITFYACRIVSCVDIKCQECRQKPTAPGVPRWSPIQVLSWPDDA